jgi:hypothetical protein
VSCQLSKIQPLESLLDTIAGACGRLLHSESVWFRLRDGDELVLDRSFSAKSYVTYRHMGAFRR